jgi:hypothetical protein
MQHMHASNDKLNEKLAKEVKHVNQVRSKAVMSVLHSGYDRSARHCPAACSLWRSLMLRCSFLRDANN